MWALPVLAVLCALAALCPLQAKAQPMCWVLFKDRGAMPAPTHPLVSAECLANRTLLGLPCSNPLTCPLTPHTAPPCNA